MYQEGFGWREIVEILSHPAHTKKSVVMIFAMKVCCNKPIVDEDSGERKCAAKTGF